MAAFNPAFMYQQQQQTHFYDDPGLSVDPNFTTVMLRNIPNKYTTKMLLQVLDRRFARQYDYVYLPVDFVNHCNVGYAFINLKTPEMRVRFHRHFHGQKVKDVLPGFNSKKVLKQVCEVNRAKVQGARENIRRIKQMSMLMVRLKEHPDWVPLTFDNNGTAVPLDLDSAPEKPQPRSKRFSNAGSSCYSAGGYGGGLDINPLAYLMANAGQNPLNSALGLNVNSALGMNNMNVNNAQSAALNNALVQNALVQNGLMQGQNVLQNGQNLQQNLLLQHQAQAAYNVAIASATAAALSTASSPSDYLSPNDWNNKDNSVSSSASTTASGALKGSYDKSAAAYTLDGNWAYSMLPANYQFQ
jgi:hypothetical protein